MTIEQPVVLITGASHGIGAACAEILLEKGMRVYGTSRRAAALPDDPPSDDVMMLPMDVHDTDSIQAAVDVIMTREGRLDVVVNNAGFGIGGAIEDTNLDEAYAQMNTNFFGVLRVCRAVLPIMRAQGRGKIINMSSIGGLVGLPFQGMYSASKFALEGMSEALRMEVKKFGIHVVLVEPGDFSTAFTSSRAVSAESKGPSVYKETFERTMAVVEHDELNGPSPDAIGKLIYRIITQHRPRAHYVIGSLFERLAVVLRRLLPYRIFEWGIMAYYKVR